MAAKAEAARGTAPAKDPSPRTKWHTGSSGPLAQLVVVQRDLMVDHTLCSPVVAVACAQQSPAVAQLTLATRRPRQSCFRKDVWSPCWWRLFDDRRWVRMIVPPNVGVAAAWHCADARRGELAGSNDQFEIPTTETVGLPCAPSGSNKLEGVGKA